MKRLITKQASQLKRMGKIDSLQIKRHISARTAYHAAQTKRHDKYAIHRTQRDVRDSIRLDSSGELILGRLMMRYTVCTVDTNKCIVYCKYSKYRNCTQVCLQYNLVPCTFFHRNHRFQGFVQKQL